MGIPSFSLYPLTLAAQREKKLRKVAITIALNVSQGWVLWTTQIIFVFARATRKLVAQNLTDILHVLLSFHCFVSVFVTEVADGECAL